jgi:pyruvate/2-oxoglutarate dehydrogenase complex dihydrolipoamide acyltransferase (E2) component
MEIENVEIKEIVPFNLQRKVAAHKTVESWANIPHAGIIINLDVTDVLQFVKKAKNLPDFQGTRITINAVLLKILAEGLKKAPQLNGYVEYSATSGNGRLYTCEDINMAVPMFLPNGQTIIPVIPQVQNKSLKEVCIEMEKMQARVKNTNIDLLLYETAWDDTMKRLKHGELWTVLKRGLSNFYGENKVVKPKKEVLAEYHKIPADQRVTTEELLSATILVSNIGAAFQGLDCVIPLLEIIPPQSAVFGVTAARRAPTVIKNAKGEEEIAIRDIMPITVIADHRANDFGPAIGMIKRIIEICATPEKLLEKPEQKVDDEPDKKLLKM